MRSLSAAALVSLLGYLVLATVGDWGARWDRTLPCLAGLIVAYLLGIRGVVGTWRIPFLGFGRGKSLDGVDPGDPARSASPPRPRALALVWAAAIGFRLFLLLHPPSLSDDLYRYLWDGRVLLSGTNPYRYPPAAPELAGVRDALWGLVNHPTLPTIYPPLLLVLFAGVMALSPTVLAWKLAVTGFDLAAAYGIQRALAVRGLPRSWVLVYLWHPLVVLEFAGNGHADAVGLALVAAALVASGSARPFLAGVALTLAGLVKFLPWVALPALIPRLRARWLVLPLIAALFYMPFLSGGVNALGSLGIYAATWRSNDLLFGLFLPEEVTQGALFRAKLLVGGLCASLWAALLWKRQPWPEVYAWTVGVLLLLSPVTHPWYLTWLVPIVLFVRQPAWWIWSLTVFLAYAPMPGWKTGGVWEESLALKCWEVAPVVALLPLQAWFALRTKPGS